MRKRYRFSLIVAVIALFGAFAANEFGASSSTFRDCAQCPAMLRIPGGSFVMGASGPDAAAPSAAPAARDNPPPQKIDLQRFALARFDVTRGQFAAFVRETGYRTGDVCYASVYDQDEQRWYYEARSGLTWRNPGYPQTDRDPVVCVGWNDAEAYVDWLSRKTGQSYRLASEAEWEYAARAGSATAQFWGNDRSLACHYANVYDLTIAMRFNSKSDPKRNFDCSDGYDHTAPVGSFDPNAFGLYDMLGNVWQWVEDCGPSAPGSEDPRHGAAKSAPDCGNHIHRGGSWTGGPPVLNAGARGGGINNKGETDLGFRVARNW